MLQLFFGFDDGLADLFDFGGTFARNSQGTFEEFQAGLVFRTNQFLDPKTLEQVSISQTVGAGDDVDIGIDPQRRPDSPLDRLLIGVSDNNSLSPLQSGMGQNGAIAGIAINIGLFIFTQLNNAFRIDFDNCERQFSLQQTRSYTGTYSAIAGQNDGDRGFLANRGEGLF